MTGPIVSLDLGQLRDFSALTVVKPFADELRCVYLHRWPLRTPYQQIVADVAKLLDRMIAQGGRIMIPELTLAIDATGLGRPILEWFQRAARGRVGNLIGVTITSGKGATRQDDGGWHVAKVELVGSVQAALSQGRLKIAASLPHAETLRRELDDFQVKVTDAGHESFNARVGQHDDLVLALAIALWLAMRPAPAPVSSCTMDQLFGVGWDRMSIEREADWPW